MFSVMDYIDLSQLKESADRFSYRMEINFSQWLADMEQTVHNFFLKHTVACKLLVSDI